MSSRVVNAVRRARRAVASRSSIASALFAAAAVRLFRRFLLLAVLVGAVGTLVVRHRPTAAKIRAHNPVARFGDKLADDLRKSRLGRALTGKRRGPVVYQVR